MSKLILAAAHAPARKNADEGTLIGYVFGCTLFLAGLVGMFALAGFSI